MTRHGSRLFIAVGSNLPALLEGAKEAVDTAIRQVAQLGPVKRSNLYVTSCFPAGLGPDFVNAVVELDADLPAQAALTALHEIEDRAGRQRAERWGPRVLDLDLLAVGQNVLPDEHTHDVWRGLPLDRQMADAPDRLILPHPRLQDRAFVLVPWADVAPDWSHPRTGLTVAQMLAALPAADVASVRRLDDG